SGVKSLLASDSRLQTPDSRLKIMLLVCSTCATRLQLDDTKVPSRPFTVRCPKCQTILNGQPHQTASNEQSALAVGESPALYNQQFKQPTPARAYKLDGVMEEKDSPFGSDGTQAPNELFQALTTLLQRGAATPQ